MGHDTLLGMHRHLAGEWDGPAERGALGHAAAQARPRPALARIFVEFGQHILILNSSSDTSISQNLHADLFPTSVSNV